VEILLFTVVAVVLYIAADRILVAVEARRGAPLPQRTVVFFCILLTLALVTFAALRAILGA
jgi:hypothetical protein